MYKSALLIIDMQKGSFTPLDCRFDSINVIARINKLSTTFRNLQLPVIHIQHDGTSTGEFMKHNKDWEIIDEIDVFNTDLKVDKTANDAFYRSNLHELLEKQKVNQLFITGCATDFCVEATVQSALVKDYNITIVKDGHTTADRPHLKAEKIIQHYNWVWSDLTPTLGKINVCSLEEILKGFLN